MDLINPLKEHSNISIEAQKAKKIQEKKDEINRRITKDAWSDSNVRSVSTRETNGVITTISFCTARGNCKVKHYDTEGNLIK